MSTRTQFTVLCDLCGGVCVEDSYSGPSTATPYVARPSKFGWHSYGCRADLCEDCAAPLQEALIKRSAEVESAKRDSCALQKTGA